MPAQRRATRIDADNPFLIVSRAGTGGHARPAGEVTIDRLADRPSLLRSLAGQIEEQRLDGPVRAAALRLLAEIDGDGRFDADLAEVARTLGMPVDLAEAGLAAIQACEPVGVGGRWPRRGGAC